MFKQKHNKQKHKYLSAEDASKKTRASRPPYDKIRGYIDSDIQRAARCGCRTESFALAVFPIFGVTEDEKEKIFLTYAMPQMLKEGYKIFSTEEDATRYGFPYTRYYVSW